MKLKFKIQPFQTEAVNAVADCFAGQPKSEGTTYRIDPGILKKQASPGPLQRKLFKTNADDLAPDGFKNQELAISPQQILSGAGTCPSRRA